MHTKCMDAIARGKKTKPDKKASPHKVGKIQLIFLTFSPNLQLYV